jgi:hypothetical protein
MESNLPTLVICDNISSLKLVRNPIMHAQTKHIDLHNHYIREKYKDGVGTQILDFFALDPKLVPKPEV